MNNESTSARRAMRHLALAAATTATLLAGTAARAHGDKHEHGVVHLDIAADGHALVVQMESPLDSVLGFEHLPRTPAQKQAVTAMLATLRQGAALFTPNAAARCRFQEAQLESALLRAPDAGATTGGAKNDAKRDATHDAKADADGETDGHQHLDIDATYRFTCDAPAELAALTHTLFSAFPRIQRLEVQTAGPRGQGKRLLRRPQATVSLGG